MLLSRRDALHGLVVVGELRRRAQRDACGGGAEVCEILAEDAARVGSLSLVPDEDALQLQVRCRSGVLVRARPPHTHWHRTGPWLLRGRSDRPSAQPPGARHSQLAAAEAAAVTAAAQAEGAVGSVGSAAARVAVLMAAA
eukprot:scaffold72176_cov68-Phaeocystis_antarctica.AAC.3